MMALWSRGGGNEPFCQTARGGRDDGGGGWWMAVTGNGKPGSELKSHEAGSDKKGKDWSQIGQRGGGTDGRSEKDGLAQRTVAF